MASKTIALDSEAYSVLAKAKRPGETFSHVVKRMLRPRRPLTDIAGAWKDLPNATIEEIRHTICRGRTLDRKGELAIVRPKEP
ncbi:MAG TPA: antitoxin VapB family protein [Thermoplasmata archaeon]|nr:antitoxin VapB family protein [Thermoplasmata archaeon]